MDDRIPTPFHAGELQAQRLAGAAPAAAPIRAFMPEQHRAFFPLLRFVCVAVPDAEGWPLATLVEGPPGFANSPDPARLMVGAMPPPADPVRVRLKEGTPAGLLGIDLGTRRRNRLNGTVAEVSEGGFAVDVVQSFGNCPRYIQVRELAPVARQAGPVTVFDAALPARAAELIAMSGTLFVASASGADAEGAASGLDISHRGGPPGFARLDGSVLSIPDYNGNRYFNTLGNFIAARRHRAGGFCKRRHAAAAGPRRDRLDRGRPWPAAAGRTGLALPHRARRAAPGRFRAGFRAGVRPTARPAWSPRTEGWTAGSPSSRAARRHRPA
jgi:predicted pyridoxine 5'-phosphate oxidase superfamily flavin-nucleotide-binding protein